jgi:regulator of chromosome condensation
VALTSSGAVYSWGCNDDGALGRPGCEDKPMLVDLPFRATDISVGDSHSVFYTNEENKAYFTGLYRVRHIYSKILSCRML